MNGTLRGRLINELELYGALSSSAVGGWYVEPGYNGGVLVPSLLQATALTMVLSFLSFSLVEKPAQRVARALGRGLQALFEP
jgi:peptidoglycan/LPS O-acetylase OafA/YrhL